MTINRKGGKHKHMKRNRNVGEERNNPKHIRKAFNEMGEFYAKVIKPYGNKRFEITIIDSTWQQKKRTMTASLRGSRKMRKLGRLTADKIVLVTYDDTINYIDIAHIYKDWEVSHLKKDKVEETGEFRIVLDNTIRDDVFSFDYSLQNTSVKTEKDDPKSISIEELTGIASDDEYNEECQDIISKNMNRNRNNKTKKEKDLDDFIDNI